MYTLNCKGRLLVLDKPVVMGILNITPDSFYSGSRVEQTDVLQKAGQMIDEGATILDIGGQSTRPGSDRLTAAEELNRILPAIKSIKENYPSVFLSIDTYHATVAKETVAAGVDLVNDISAGDMDANMLSTVASLNVPFIAMHMQGTPATMQQNPQYNNVVLDVLDYLVAEVAKLRALGIKDIILDPGFGFGKTLQHNIDLMKATPLFSTLGAGVLVGVSRKRMIAELTGQTDPGLRTAGSVAAATYAAQHGAAVLRVHDVRETVEALKVAFALNQ